MVGREGTSMRQHALQGFDDQMNAVLEQWNAPGVGVGIVEGDELVYASGYGFRDYEARLPFTPQTLCQIGSNTKLFTAIAAGMLVEEGKLAWDEPIRDTIPAIGFYNNELNNTVTLRDMLSHRTGITRHDLIWYRSPFSRRELFERLRYLEPAQPLRQMFLYNNLMYAAVGYAIELLSGKTWEEFIRERILAPLGMTNTVYSIEEMLLREDHAVLYSEKRDSSELSRISYYEDVTGVAPAGAIISNVEEMSHWLIALMNDGKFRGERIIPSAVLAASSEPAIAQPNAEGDARGFWELLNSAYCMGRMSTSYRGNLALWHNGYIDGMRSEVWILPNEHTGVIVFVIGSHCAALSNVVTYNLLDRVLGMEPISWNDRYLPIIRAAKTAQTEARAKAGDDRIPGTRPSHPLPDFTGMYEHPAYGEVRIGLNEEQLRFEFHHFDLPLAHFHYDRFDTPDDERDGKWSLNFLTNPQGAIDKIVMSLDEAEVTFARRPYAAAPETLAKLAGAYKTPDGITFRIALKDDGYLYQVVPGQPDEKLIPYAELKFRVARFSTITAEFVLEGGAVAALKVVAPGGELRFPRILVGPGS